MPNLDRTANAPSPSTVHHESMAGRVKHLIDELIQLRAAGNPGVTHFLRAHLMLIGIDPERYTERSPDDEAKEQTLRQMIRDFRSRS